MTTAKHRVLFLCTDNSVRSQIAEGLLRDRAGDRFDVFSAGITATSVRPEAVEVMAELHVALQQHTSKTLEQFLPQRFDYVITVCSRPNQAFPDIPGARKRLDWSFPDPPRVADGEDAGLSVFRAIRAVIDAQLDRFLNVRRQPVVSDE